MAAHIHMVVKEPDRREYWIDEVVFKDDPHVNPTNHPVHAQGSSGLISLVRRKDGAWTGIRKIYLEPHP